MGTGQDIHGFSMALYNARSIRIFGRIRITADGRVGGWASGPGDWWDIPPSILKTEGGGSILSQYGGQFFRKFQWLA